MPSSSVTPSLWEKSIDFIFSNDSRKWLLVIVILGALLRIIVASNLPPVADEMVHGTHALGVSKLAPLSTMAQAQVWYYLTDYGYRLFGVHLLTARLLSVVFGTLSIILVYLLGSLLFSKRAGLIAAFLLAISIFHITWAAAYQDQTMMFFVLLASYFFIKTYQEKGTISYLSAVFLGVAILVKIITGIFIFMFGAFMLGILYKDYKKKTGKFQQNIKRVLVFVLILFIATIPILAYNYFLYKEKGIVDLALAQFLRINAEYYTGPGLAHGQGFVIDKLPRNLYIVITHYFAREDFLVSLCGLVGLIYVTSRLKKKNFGELFMASTCIISLLFIASAIVLQTHYTSFFPFFSLFAGGVLAFIETKIINRDALFYSKLCFILVLLAFSFYSLGQPLTSQSAIEKVREYAVDHIGADTLVILDARIYRGTNAWAFSDKHYAESSYLVQILDNEDTTSPRIPVRTVFVECVTDDCGWGTVKDQPEFNSSVEAIVDAFRNVSQSPIVITGGGSISGIRDPEVRGQPYFRVYEAVLPLKNGVLQAVDATHSHFFYHIPRDENPEQAFDYYKVRGGVDSLINLFAYGFLYCFLIIAVVSLGVPFWLVLKQK